MIDDMHDISYKRGQQKYGCTGAFLDYRLKEIKLNFDIFLKKNHLYFSGRADKKESNSGKNGMDGSMTAECENVGEKLRDKQGKQEVIGLEKETVTVDSPIGSGPS